MNWWVVDSGLVFVENYGLLALFMIFVLEGALIGKLLPTRAVLVGIIVLFGGSRFNVVSVLIVAVMGATIGQWLLFMLIRHRGISWVTAHPYIRVSERWIERGEYWFEQWGLHALLISNTLPVVRGYGTIPVAMSRVPRYKFIGVSVGGTMIYISLLIAVALGIERFFFLFEGSFFVSSGG